MPEKKLQNVARVSEKSITFAPANKKQGRSPVGLERCSHIAEVPGSSPGVPTERQVTKSGLSFSFQLKNLNI